MQEVSCVICGKVFTTNIGIKKTCSPECAKERKKICNKQLLAAKRDDSWKVERNCKICGSKFMPVRNQQVTCSDKCQKMNMKLLNRDAAARRYAKIKSERDNSPKNCIICGKEFMPNTPREISCSDECKQVRNRQVNKANKELLKALPKKKQCAVCGEYFEYTGRPKLCCSEACDYKRTHKPNIRECACCGKEFKAITNQIYCSSKCRGSVSRDITSDFTSSIYRKTIKPRISIQEINARAREKGMSYGQYMAVYGDSNEN